MSELCVDPRGTGLAELGAVLDSARIPLIIEGGVLPGAICEGRFLAHDADVERRSLDVTTTVRLEGTEYPCPDPSIDYLKFFYEAHLSGIELDRFPHNERSAPQERPLRILAMGRMTAKKGFRYLVEALGGEEQRLIPRSRRPKHERRGSDRRTT